MTLIHTVFQCSKCGAQKQVANHWWIVFRFDPAKVKDRIIINLPRMFEIREWNVEDAFRADAIHVCGGSCLQKIVSEICHEITAANAPQSVELNQKGAA